jgi:magnesium transporter
MFPTLVASLFGMNLINGMESNSMGFPIAIAISLFISVGSWFILRWKKLL